LNLLCDEDVGTGIPTALDAVGLNARSLYQFGMGGRPDVEWLAKAGQQGWLVLSCNKKMLTVPAERAAIIDNDVGIVFLTTGEEKIIEVLKRVLAKWNVLELLDATEPRPFARFLSPNGRFSVSYRGLQL